MVFINFLNGGYGDVYVKLCLEFDCFWYFYFVYRNEEICVLLFSDFLVNGLK